MTGRRRHRSISPETFLAIYDDAPGIRIGAQQISAALIWSMLTGWSRPRSPLYTVDRPEIRLYHLPIRPRW